MEAFGSKDVLYIVGYAATIVATFLITKHGIRDYVRDKYDQLKDEITQIKIENKELKSRDDLQQQVIDQLRKQLEDLIPKLVEAIKRKEK